MWLGQPASLSSGVDGNMLFSDMDVFEMGASAIKDLMLGISITIKKLPALGFQLIVETSPNPLNKSSVLSQGNCLYFYCVHLPIQLVSYCFTTTGIT